MTMDIKKHIQVVAAVQIAFGVLGLLIAAFLFVTIVGGGMLSGDQDAIAITGVVGTIIGGFLGLMSLPSVVAGAGLLKHQSWARWLTLILSALNLVNVPVGTLIGIYSIWVLLKDEAEELLH